MKTKFLALIAMLLCVCTLFVACLGGNSEETTNGDVSAEQSTEAPVETATPEDNKAALVTLINTAITETGSFLGELAKTDMSDMSGIYEDLMANLGEQLGTELDLEALEFEANVDETVNDVDAYLGMKEGVVCFKATAAEMGEQEAYIFVEDLKITVVYSTEDGYDKEVIDLQQYFDMMSQSMGSIGGEGAPEIDFSEIEWNFPAITADDVKIEGDKYVISNDYLKKAVDQTIDTLVVDLMEATGMDAATVEETIAPTKEAIETYLPQLGLEISFNMENKAITGSTIAVDFADELVAEMGYETFAISFSTSCQGALLSSMSLDLDITETETDGVKGEFGVVFTYNAEQMPETMTAKLELTANGTSNYEYYYDEETYEGVDCMIKTDTEIKFDLAIDARKTAVGDKPFDMTLSIVEDNVRTFVYDDETDEYVGVDEVAGIDKAYYETNVSVTASISVIENGIGIDASVKEGETELLNVDVDMTAVEDKYSLTTVVKMGGEEMVNVAADLEIAEDSATITVAVNAYGEDLCDATATLSKTADNFVEPSDEILAVKDAPVVEQEPMDQTNIEEIQ